MATFVGGAMVGGVGSGGLGPSYGYRAPNPIAGGLPFPSQQAAGSIPFGGNPAQLSQSYANAYNSALAMNQQNYQNVLKGFQDALNAQAQKQHNTQVQHYELENQIRNDLNLAGSTRRQEIQDEYARLAGAQSQQLIDRGLGNSTVQASVNRGLALDEAKAQNQLAEQVANLRAQYGSNLGLARIAQHGQGSREATALTQAQLDFMNSVQSPYPDAGLYASLAQQYEQARAMEQASGSGYGFSAVPRGMGPVTYGPKDPNWGRPSPGTFAASGSFTIPGPSTGLGYNPAFMGMGGPTGYVGTTEAPAESSGAGGGLGVLGLLGPSLAAGADIAALHAGGGQQKSSPSLFGMSLSDLGKGG